MLVGICLDDKNGMLFNKRRQSRDQMLIQDFLHTIEGELYITAYSEILFQEMSQEYHVVENPLEEATEKDSCFIESAEVSSHLQGIQKLIIYRCNRHYPSDKKLQVNMEEVGFAQVSCSEFLGSSHEKITKEVWEK